MKYRSIEEYIGSPFLSCNCDNIDLFGLYTPPTMPVDPIVELKSDIMELKKLVMLLREEVRKVK